MSALPGLIRPLRLIFWGGLLCLFDFTVTDLRNGEGLRFDLLNDFLGMVLISAGVFGIARSEFLGPSAPGLIFVRIVCVVSSLKALIDHWVFRTPTEWSIFWNAHAILELAAVLIFCAAMVRLCRRAGLPHAGGSWRMTFALFLVLVVLPVGGLQLAVLQALLTSTRFSWNAGSAAILVLLVLMIPFIHFFVSTSRTRREIESVQAAQSQVEPYPPPLL